MIVIEKSPEPKIRPAYQAELRVERTDISFHDVAGGRVRIRVTVHNVSDHRSHRTFMRLASAPLGAFVPWRPLTVLPVPGLDPGESRELTAEVARPHPAPLGDFDRIPPERLLRAVNSPDEPPPPSGNGSPPMPALRRLRPGGRPLERVSASAEASLVSDLLELAGWTRPHWAGNIEVFVGSRSVERHLASGLRVYPGCTNLALFTVGDPSRRDAYAFELVGLTPDWKAELHDVTGHSSFLIKPSDEPIQETRWVESNGSRLMTLTTRPPAGCQAGNLEVRVTRRSCGRTAIVEFDLDPAAPGAGCRLP